MFDYLPDEDNLLPCKDIGLTLRHGDILEVSDEERLFGSERLKFGPNSLFISVLSAAYQNVFQIGFFRRCSS